MIRTFVALTSILALMATSANAQQMDGTLVGDEAFYMGALSVQNTDTQFGDAFNGGSIDGGGGSEINQVFGRVANGRLHVLVTGNLEPNFNKMSFFFDSVGGGHNTIDGITLPSGVDGFCCGGFGTPDGALQRMNGLTFDTGFEADYFLTFSNGYENALDDPMAPGNPITFWGMSAHYSDLTAGAAADRQNVAAGMQLAPRGKPNVLRFDHLNDPKTFADAPYLPNVALNGDTDPTHIGPALPNLGQGELIDRDYALGDGTCADDTGSGCLATELGFALDQSPSDPTNALSHRNFDNVIDLEMGWDNSNFQGVAGGPIFELPTIGNPADVVTGLEFSIPLSELGNPNGDIRMVAFINGNGHDFASNQFAGDGILSGNLGGDGMGGFTGDLAGVNLASIDGNQFVTIPNVTVVDPDFNMDGNLDCLDINALSVEIAAGTDDGAFDLTGDGVVNGDDLDQWLVEGGVENIGAAYLAGDANLDGVVDGQDFIAWNQFKFTAVGTGAQGYCDGDFNADGVVDGQDFIVWNTVKFTSSMDGHAVPEPALAGWGLLVAAWYLGRRRR